MREIGISELSISRIAVRGRYYITCLFFPREIRTYNKWFLHSNKRWISERFSLLSRYELLLLEHILCCFNIFIFLYYYQFYSHPHHYCYDYFCYYCFYHCHYHYYFFIFNAFNFYFASFYHSILSLYISNVLRF